MSEQRPPVPEPVDHGSITPANIPGMFDSPLGHGLTAPAIAVDSIPGIGGPSLDGEGRRRTNRLSPLISVAQALPALLLLGLTVLFPVITSDRPAKWFLLAGVLVLLAIGLLWSYIGWTRLAYWFDESGDFRVDSGVLQRNERRLQLSRLQSVDVVQPLLARLAGMAQVRVEVAGAGDSKVTLSYLTAAEAAALRGEIIARAAGVRPDAGEAPERVLVTVPPSDLLKSLLLTAAPWVAVVFTILLAVFTWFTAGPGGLVLLLITGGAPILYVINMFTDYYNFTVADSPDGLRIRRGLLKTQAQTVPPGRIHAIAFVEPPLWRRRGWVRVRLAIAGVGTGSQSQDGQTQEALLLPVAPWPVARDLVAHLMPGFDISEIPLSPAPERIRWRAPIQGRQLAVGYNDYVFVARTGFFVRTTSAVTYVRTQSVRLVQGPWSKRLDVASVHVDVVPGRVSIRGHYRNAAEARELVDLQAYRARTARADKTDVRWAAPPAAVGLAASDVPASQGAGDATGAPDVSEADSARE